MSSRCSANHLLRLHDVKKRPKPTSKRPTPPVRMQETVRLSVDGAAMLFGDLEYRVMEAAWAIGHPASARDLHARIHKSHKVESVTVVTVCNRLVDKGMLVRAKQDAVFHYAAKLPLNECTHLASRPFVERILGPRRQRDDENT
mgnify:CR=1 FL=1